ncbi:hypothetical protein [Kiloniella sp.]|uniref:hypothetical protein n=1 Tax=Kiloniella sp. TaxID=1938587 RepID=UPI003B0274BA
MTKFIYLNEMVCRRIEMRYFLNIYELSLRNNALMINCFKATVAVVCLVWAGAASAEDLEFLLSNQSSSPIIAFHVSSASSGEWESNLMEGGILDSGYEIDVLIADGMETCEYDIRADFEDGEVVEDYDLDLCELGSYTFE